jgi:hypothetical protein
MDTDAAKELKALREQNARLRRLLAEAELVKDALREHGRYHGCASQPRDRLYQGETVRPSQHSVGLSKKRTRRHRSIGRATGGIRYRQPSADLHSNAATSAKLATSTTSTSSGVGTFSQSSSTGPPRECQRP